MAKDHMLKTACGLSSLWDGKPITRIRGGDDNLLLYGRRFSSHLMIQEVVLSTVLKNDLLVGQGLIARCLIVAPLTNGGERSYNPIDVSKDPLILDFRSRITKILDRPYPLASMDIQNELAPRGLSLDLTAKARWISFHDEIDRSLRVDGHYYQIRRTANKAAEQALRIAGILTLIENFDAVNISLNAIEQAIELIRFYLDEALRITEVSCSDPDLELAQKVLNWMLKKDEGAGGGKVFPLQEMYRRAGPRGIRKKKEAQKIMSILEDHRLVERPDKNKEEWTVSGSISSFGAKRANCANI